jgi:hypothetical protein
MQAMEENVMDLLYLGVVLIFFTLTWGLLKLCEGLLGEKQ